MRESLRLAGGSAPNRLRINVGTSSSQADPHRGCVEQGLPAQPVRVEIRTATTMYFRDDRHRIGDLLDATLVESLV
jgi:hypothetical protein